MQVSLQSSFSSFQILIGAMSESFKGSGNILFVKAYIPANIRLNEDVLKTSFVFVFRRRLDQDEYVRLSLRSSEDVFKMSWPKRIYSSWPYVFKTSPRHLQDVLPRRLQDVFKMSSRRLEKLLQEIFKTSSRRFEDVFKTSSRRLAKISSRRSFPKTVIYRGI